MKAFFNKYYHNAQVRTRLYRTFVWAIFLLMAIAMTIPSLIRQPSSPSSWAIKVNGEKISIKEFIQREEIYQTQLSYLKEDFAQRGLPFDPRLLGIDLHQITINSFVENVLLNKLSEKLYINLDQEFVAQQLAQPYFLRQELANFLSPYVAAALPDLSAATLNHVLRQKGYTLADFEYFVEQNLKRQTVKDIIMNGVYIPSFEARSKYIQNYAAKDYSIVTISLDTVLEQVKEKALTAEELKAFYDEQVKTAKHYTVPEKRSGSVWEFAPEQYGIVISDENVRSYYDAHKQKFISSPAQVKVRRILFKISEAVPTQVSQARAEVLRKELEQAPDTFAQKAKELSEDAASAKKGGLIEFFARGDKEPAFEKVAFKLKSDGDISEVFATSEGIEILQRVEKKPISYKSFDAVKGDIKEMLVRQEFKRQFAKDMERLDKLNVTGGADEFDRFIKDKKAKHSSLRDVAADKSGPATQLFKVKAVGNLAYAREEDKAILVKLTDIKKSYTPKLEAIKDMVSEDLYKQKARKEFLRVLGEAKQKAATHDLAYFEKTLAKDFDGKVKSISSLSNDDTDRINKLMKDGYPVIQMLQMEKENGVITHFDGNEGYVIRLNRVEPFDEKEFALKKKEIINNLYRRDASSVVAGFIAYLGRNATIEVNKKAFKTSQDTTER